MKITLHCKIEEFVESIDRAYPSQDITMVIEGDSMGELVEGYLSFLRAIGYSDFLTEGVTYETFDERVARINKEHPLFNGVKDSDEELKEEDE